MEENTKSLALIGKIGGACYVAVCGAASVLAYIHLSAALLVAGDQRTKPVKQLDPNESFAFMACIGFFLAGLIFYRILALRRGYYQQWIWWAILASGILMIVAGITSGRIVLIFFGGSNLLHCGGTKSLYFQENNA
jgi:hypothetical protein